LQQQWVSTYNSFLDDVSVLIDDRVDHDYAMDVALRRQGWIKSPGDQKLIEEA
jgi:hypothetical protein